MAPSAKERRLAEAKREGQKLQMGIVSDLPPVICESTLLDRDPDGGRVCLILIDCEGEKIDRDEEEGSDSKAVRISQRLMQLTGLSAKESGLTKIKGR